MGILLVLSLFLLALLGDAQTAVTMNRYDRRSLGWDTHERVLNARNVSPSSFGKLYSYYVHGAVYAQPLYVRGVLIPHRGTHNVVYVVTMNDKAYAFDAKKNGPPLWMRDFSDETAGVTPVPITDITKNNDLNLVGNVGIESTPVLDLKTQSMFLVVRTKENGKYFQRLRKLDLRTGGDQIPPKVIEASVPGLARDAVNGFVRFDPKAGNQRSALAISGGNVIIAWASHEDLQPYHGWIMAYDTGTLQQTGVLCITPDGAAGGIWQSGRAPVVDNNGEFYFEVGNGSWDGKRNFGDSVIKVKLDHLGLHVEDFYTPHNYAQQNETDADLGSTGPLLIPDSNLLICGNKQGEIFVLDKNHLGGLSQKDTGVRQALDLRGGRVMAGPSFWNGPNGPALFIWNESTTVEEFRLERSTGSLSRFAKGQILSHGSPGGALTISSDGATAGTGVLWATVGKDRSADHGNAPGVLRAFNVETLEELWNSEADRERDYLGTLVKFVPPLVINGRVYVPNYDNAVNVYGLLASGK